MHNLLDSHLFSLCTVALEITITCTLYNMVATGQGKVREIQGQRKVREF